MEFFIKSGSIIFLMFTFTDCLQIPTWSLTTPYQKPLLSMLVQKFKHFKIIKERIIWISEEFKYFYFVHFIFYKIIFDIFNSHLKEIFSVRKVVRIQGQSLLRTVMALWKLARLCQATSNVQLHLLRHDKCLSHISRLQWNLNTSILNHKTNVNPYQVNWSLIMWRSEHF